MMQLFIKNMTEQYATEILSWKYEKPYDFYNNDLTKSAIQEMLDDTYYVVTDTGQEVVGFFCIGKAAQVPPGKLSGAYVEDYIDFGVGIKPNLTGKGYGFDFCSKVLDFINEYKNVEGVPIRLSVATFNKRAIHLYEKLGFVKDKDFSTNTTTFITMIKK